MKNGLVLIVEDDHDIRVALRNCLEEAGYAVVSATNGVRALEILKEMTKPKVIILDMNMPLMNGDEFLRVIKNDLDLKTISVIQISAATNLQRSGVCCALPKPIDINRLLRAIEDCVKAA